MTFSLLGALLALAMFLLTTSPSLIPRPWWAQACFSGVMMTVGYIIGFFIDWVARLIIDVVDLTVTYDEIMMRNLRLVATAAVAIFFIVQLARNYRASRRTAELVEMRPPSVGRYIAALAGAFLLTQVFVWGYELIYRAWKLVRTLVSPFIPGRVAPVLSWVIVAALFYLIGERGVFRQVAKRIAKQASLRDRENPAGVRRPEIPERTTGEGSPVEWASTAREAKRFLGAPLMRECIEGVSGPGAREPIRVYSSLSGREDYAAAVREAIAEMHRTGAFERPSVLVIVPTGSGWVDEWNVQAFEHLTRGDCASVAVQYSFLPSWVTFVSHREQAAYAGRLVIDAVTEEIARRAPDDRPKLYVTGESLGAFGGQAAFVSSADMLARVDGALWIGTPGFTPLVRELGAARHRGSPQIAPVVNNAAHVRFATKPADMCVDLYGRSLGAWEHPRVVYVQHASDPVVCWHPSLAWHAPDWLHERAGTDVSAQLEWHRLITFGQILCDLPLAEAAGAGHGHCYHEELIPAWRAILGRSDGETNVREDAAIADAIRAQLP